jgi:lactoylglutathione lyase
MNGTTTLNGNAVSVSLTVNDLEKSLAWYRDVFGFTVDRQHERDGQVRAVSLRAGEVRVLIGQDDGAKGLNRTKGEGFSIMIVTDQNVDEIADGIRQRGGTLASEPVDMPWGPRVFRVQDPDGFKFAISSGLGPRS